MKVASEVVDDANYDREINGDLSLPAERILMILQAKHGGSAESHFDRAKEILLSEFPTDKRGRAVNLMGVEHKVTSEDLFDFTDWAVEWWSKTYPEDAAEINLRTVSIRYDSRTDTFFLTQGGDIPLRNTFRMTSSELGGTIKYINERANQFGNTLHYQTYVGDRMAANDQVARDRDERFEALMAGGSGRPGILSTTPLSAKKKFKFLEIRPPKSKGIHEVVGPRIGPQGILLYRHLMEQRPWGPGPRERHPQPGPPIGVPQ
jgi:hypothetical protein